MKPAWARRFLVPAISALVLAAPVLFADDLSTTGLEHLEKFLVAAETRGGPVTAGRSILDSRRCPISYNHGMKSADPL